jgi:hypothetical protein
MDLRDLFRYPKASWVEAFSQAQLHLYRHDISLQDYFEAIQAPL